MGIYLKLSYIASATRSKHVYRNVLNIFNQPSKCVQCLYEHTYRLQRDRERERDREQKRERGRAKEGVKSSLSI